MSITAIISAFGGDVTDIWLSWWPGEFFTYMICHVSDRGGKGSNTKTWHFKASFYNTWSTFKIRHQLAVIQIFKTEINTYCITVDGQYKAEHFM